MRALARFFTRERASLGRRPRLAEALITDRRVAYASYRLRYLFVRVMLRSLLHLLEVSLFSLVFDGEFLGPMIVMRAVTGMCGNLWWGALESLRERVRQAASVRTLDEARRVIDGWLLVTIVLAVAVAGGGAAWVLTHPHPQYGFSIFDAYAIACLLRLGLDLIARTYHSGLFALQRIYRPLWSLIAIDVLDAALIVLLWPLTGAWCFAVALLAAGIVRFGLGIGFTAAAYRSSRIPAGRLRLMFRGLKWLSVRDLYRALWHALANAAFEVDAVLIAVLVSRAHDNLALFRLAVAFYLLRPFLAAGHGWARLFYFDFKALERGFSGLLRARFEHFLKLTAAVLCIVLALLAALFAAVFYEEMLDLTLVALLPFFVARFFVGLYQVQAFAYGRYRYLFALGLGVGLLTLGVWLAPVGALTIALGLGAAFILILCFGAPVAETRRAQREVHACILPLTHWLADLAATSVPVRLGVARVRTGVPVHRVAAAFAERLNDGAVTRLGWHKLLWFEDGSAPLSVSRSRLARATAGCVGAVGFGEVADSGRQALEQALSFGVPDPDLAAALGSADLALQSQEALISAFKAQFKDGVVLDRRAGSLPRRAFGAGPQLVGQVLGAIASADGRTVPRRLPGVPFDVIAYCPAGELEAVFVLPRSVPADERLSFRRTVEQTACRRSVL